MLTLNQDHGRLSLYRHETQSIPNPRLPHLPSSLNAARTLARSPEDFSKAQHSVNLNALLDSKRTIYSMSQWTASEPTGQQWSNHVRGMHARPATSAQGHDMASQDLLSPEPIVMEAAGLPGWMLPASQTLDDILEYTELSVHPAPTKLRRSETPSQQMSIPTFEQELDPYEMGFMVGAPNRGEKSTTQSLQFGYCIDTTIPHGRNEHGGSECIRYTSIDSESAKSEGLITKRNNAPQGTLSNSVLCMDTCCIEDAYHDCTEQEQTERQAKDEFLVRSKQSGMSYRDIKVKGQFKEAESTLRGRYRTLTKPRASRTRRPQWTERDVVPPFKPVSMLISLTPGSS